MGICYWRQRPLEADCVEFNIWEVDEEKRTAVGRWREGPSTAMPLQLTGFTPGSHRDDVIITNERTREGEERTTIPQCNI
ncbi:hypothetical protein LSAT2_023272 [Lamellibrachia satsuma]|nr:hypothetical protein LSAT2_023272 [Lamellibrachia satsuma]